MNQLSFTQDYVVYKSKREGVYPIKQNDWNRIKRMVKGIIPNKEIFKIIASASFGVFFSSIFSLIGLSTAQSLSNWVFPTVWILLLVSLLSGIGFSILRNMQKKIITNTSENVLDEMNIIETSFEEINEN